MAHLHLASTIDLERQRHICNVVLLRYTAQLQPTAWSDSFGLPKQL